MVAKELPLVVTRIKISVSALACLLIVCTINPVALAVSKPQMGSSMRPNITSLLESNKQSYPLPGDWKIGAFTFSDRRIDVTLENGEGKSLTALLSYPMEPPKGLLIGKTKSFRVELMESHEIDTSDAEEVAGALLKRIRRNDFKFFFASKDMETAIPYSVFWYQAYLIKPLISIGGAIAVLMLLTGLVRHREILLPKPHYMKLLLILLVLVAVFVRVGISPGAPVHANYHGIREIRSIVYRESGEEKEANYGLAYPVLMRSILERAGATETNLFMANLVFNVVAVLFLFFLAKLLFENDLPAFAAGLAAALSPCFVWLAATESPASAYMACAFAGLTLLILAIKGESRIDFPVSAFFIAVAASMKLLTVLIVPVFFAVALYEFTSPVRRNAILGEERTRRIVLASLVLILTIVALHLASLNMELRSGMLSRLESVPIGPAKLLKMEQNMLLEPTLVPWIIPWLAVAGLGLLWWYDRRKALLISFMVILLVPPGYIVNVCRTDMLRYQTPVVWTFFLAAAYVPCRVVLLRGDWLLKSFILIAIFAGIIMTSLSGLRILAAGNEAIHEYKFIRDFIREAGEVKSINLPSPELDDAAMLVEFPDYLAQIEILHGKDYRTMGSGIYYLGLSCYKYDPEEPGSDEMRLLGVRPECASVREHECTAIEETALEVPVHPGSYNDRIFEYLSSEPVVGFYECI